MRMFPAVVCCLFIASSAAGQNQVQADESQIAAAAMVVLDAWHASSTADNERLLHVVCWTPSDRDFPAGYRPRLTRMLKHIQNFYLVEMERLGLGSRTFNLQADDDEELTLHTVKGIHSADHYAVRSGNEIRSECLPALTEAGIDPSQETVLIFCNLATWDEENLQFSHKSPYYASGSFRKGTAWQLDSPELDPRNLTLLKPMIRDGQYGRISLGKHNSIFIGGVAHELGHALGLPHCKARQDEAVRGTALMGAGNRTYGDELRAEGRGSFLTLAHGLRLASHPQFSQSTKGLTGEARVDIKGLSFDTQGDSIRVSGTVQGDPPVYAVVAYFDPEGGGDYNATTACAVPATDGRFSLNSGALPPGKAGELRLFPLHANGSAAGQMSRTHLRYPYDVSHDGTPDLTIIQVKQDIAPVVLAINNGQPEIARQRAEAIKLPRALAVSRRLLEPYKPTRSPENFAGASDSVPLTRFKTTFAEVGWGRQAYNRVPDKSLILESAGRIYDTGIYAHAPARHVYQLGGEWKSLHGTAGLAAGHRGSVRFEIKGDGRSLWASKTVKADATIQFDVTLSGVDELELLTFPTNDGPGGDWGMWLDSTLKR